MSRAAIKVPADLPALVRTAFARARAEGELHYFASVTTLLSVGGIPFQLRFSPALASKPRRAAAEQAADPFAYPPRSLLVADLGPAHYLVLNKFAVVAEHFILATRAFRPQTGLLDEVDLEAALACIRAYREVGGGGLFAFFNSGEHSGASQPHCHLQLLPVASMRDGLAAAAAADDDEAWSPLASRRRHLDAAPFASFAAALGPRTSPRDLHAAYLGLYQRACRAVSGGDGNDDDNDDDEDGAGEATARISYNLAMTEDALVVCPRRAEGDDVRCRRSGAVVGKLALNGTVLAGTALVRTRDEWEALRDDPAQLARVLGRIGVPRAG